jgi:hypothetical protein
MKAAYKTRLDMLNTQAGHPTVLSGREWPDGSVLPGADMGTGRAKRWTGFDLAKGGSMKTRTLGRLARLEQTALDNSPLPLPAIVNFGLTAALWITQAGAHTPTNKHGPKPGRGGCFCACML